MKRRQETPRCLYSPGFTLIELLMVLFIMGLIAATLTLTLTPGQSQNLMREAEGLALAFEEIGNNARLTGHDFEWRPVAAGYAVKRLQHDGEEVAAVREFLLPEGIRIQQVRMDAVTPLEFVIIPARGLAGPVMITLASADQEIDIVSAGLNRFELSSLRVRSVRNG